jgi:hypothetical protein
MRKELTLPKLKKKAQDIFNAWIRNRDKELGCISCNNKIDHAGHYFSSGHYSALTFDEMNVNGQCLRCNNFMHGNLINYRIGLIERYGEDKVNELEGSRMNAVKKWSRDELKQIALKYKIKD